MDWIAVSVGAAGMLIILSVCALVWFIRYAWQRLDSMEERLDASQAYLATHIDRTLASLQVKP